MKGWWQRSREQQHSFELIPPIFTVFSKQSGGHKHCGRNLVLLQKRSCSIINVAVPVVQCHNDCWWSITSAVIERKDLVQGYGTATLPDYLEMFRKVCGRNGKRPRIGL